MPNLPQGNTPDTGPLEEDFNFVLRRPDILMRPWREHFYDGVSVARDVTHPDGIRAATHFVAKHVHMMVLYRKGWKRVTGSWNEAVKAGWSHGDNEVGENWWATQTPEETEDTPLVDPDDLGDAKFTDLDGNPVEPNEDGSPIEGTPVEDDPEAPRLDPVVDDLDPGDDPEDLAIEAEEVEEVEGDEPKVWTWAEIVGLGYTDLQGELKLLGEKASGTKGDLRIRLAEKLGVTPE
jgi:hypothetical protein